MSVISTAGWVEKHRQIVISLRAETLLSADRILPGLREGWDFSVTGSCFVFEPMGIPRVPHIAIMGNVAASRIPGKPIFSIDMTALEIEAGIYRQCGIRPESIADGTSIAADPYEILPDEDYDPARAWIFRAITGHAPRDAALFLAAMLKRRPDIGKHLLAKNFNAALAAAPDLLGGIGWPDEVRAGWATNGGGDYLPPFLVLALHAEFACHRMSDRGMIALSFDDNGRQVTTRGFIDGIVPDVSRTERVTMMPLPGPVEALIDMVPFQTYALLPPTAAFSQRDGLLGRAWSRHAATLIPSMIGDYGAESIDTLMSFTGHLSPTALKSNVEAHPKSWREQRKAYGHSLQKRPAVEYWGLDRRQNVAVGLLEIALDAQAWNQKYRPDGPDLRTDTTKQILANAMQTVCCLWLEDAGSAAVTHIDKEIREGFREKKTREPTIYDDETLDDVCRRSGFGSGLLRTAEKLIRQRAKPGAEGYTARRKAHLWFSNCGDDVGHYHRLQLKAVADYLACRFAQTSHQHGERNYMAGTAPTGLAAKPVSMTTDPEAAYCARDNAMMVTSHGLDPMRSFLSRDAGSTLEMAKGYGRTDILPGSDRTTPRSTK